MKKYSLILMLMMLPFLFTACGDDEPSSDRSLPTKTMNVIKSVFPGLRLDSIDSYEDFDNIKIKYDGVKLISYEEKYASGAIHDGVQFSLRWESNTIHITQGSRTYTAVLGDNGCVSEIVSSNGNRFQCIYDDEMRLIKYHDIPYNDSFSEDRFVELSWENGNVVKCRVHWTNNWCDYFYKYGQTRNVAGLLNPMSHVYKWIRADVMVALYYAGVLGKGTNDLPISITNRWQNGQNNQSYSFTYNIDSNGYVTSCSDGWHSDKYYYAK